MRLSVFCLLLCVGTAVAQPVATAPSPGLGAREVVLAQLAALRAVDSPTPGAGFATAFRFASPENRAQTGPAERFGQMIREGYGELINHRSAQLLPALQQGQELAQPVDVTTRAGRVLRYVFLLRRVSEPGCRGCWMTDGVIQDQAAGNSSET